MVDSFHHALFSKPETMGSTIYNIHNPGHTEDLSNLPGYMVDPIPIVEDLYEYSPTSPIFPDNPYLYDLLINQPPPSILSGIHVYGSPFLSGVGLNSLLTMS